ncbi:Glutamate--tRNA ligase [Apiospora phragmitis]|uniref:Glutamate--tRNA ligase n=1 Tax=Apiospora phragmitis TaxID=2905665 RepID=A0ABR1ULX5_9PEZI
MRYMQHVGGPLRWVLPRAQLTAGTTTIFKRFAFAGRPEKVEQKLTQARALPTTPARTRFAPSPTGYLHLGSLRTALFNYLLAKATGGQFLLRLEDTDQSERLPIYRQHVKGLLEQDKAYHCFCSPERLDEIRKLAMANGEEMTGYDGHCSHIPAPESERRAASGEAHCVRFKTHDSNFKPLFSDLVYGAYKPPPGSVDDFVIMKRDGFPTYHFANVVDDHLMEITHVIRGAEWLVSTPRHVGLYDAFGWKPPTFAHVGLLTDQNKQKLSKRQGDIDIASYRNKGYLPEGLLNYVVLLGWESGQGDQGNFRGHGSSTNDRKVVHQFHLRFTRGDIRVSNKLDFLNNKHKSIFLAQSPEDLQAQVVPPLSLAIRNLEKERAHLSTGPPQLSEDTDNNMAATLGQFIPAMALPPLRSDGGQAAATAGHDDDNAGLPTTRPTSAKSSSLTRRQLYQQTLLESLRELRYLFVRTPAAAAAAADNGTEHTESEMSAAGIAGLFADALRDIPADESSWTKERLEEALNPLIKSIFAMRTSPETQEPWGFHMLRWFLFALQPGPALFPSMVVLGKAETMGRIQRAIDSIACDLSAEDSVRRTWVRNKIKYWGVGKLVMWFGRPKLVLFL